MDQINDENMNKKMKYEEGEIKNIRGTVLLMKKKFLDSNDLTASLVDRLDEIVGNKVSLQLISAVNGDPGKPLSVSLSLLNFNPLFPFLAAAAAASQVL
ncbi:hypothetical protein Acr_15g0015790 [Actinidia rufa]|uniref:Uncharacterized protein n=1 Tax=Actinidia rufa TaxID=165716 RepID=A0A7J0FW91_9ERIC|nr:hypothetical protein Acr_15g0015790 [Actinidia rufa]